MPELPEVQTVVASLAPAAVGAKIIAIDAIRPDYIEPAGTRLDDHLVGRRMTSIHRRGKRILIALDNGQRMLIHLGMTGRLTVEVPDSPHAPHTHLVLTVRKQASLREIHMIDPRRFGRIVWLGTATGEDGLGPEPLTLTPKVLASLLVGRRPIKSLLLDQTCIAGLGNIYADESLFEAGIHPLTPANSINIEQTRILCRAIKQVLRKALRHNGSSLRDYVDAAGRKGAFQKLHNVYGRSGWPCRKCDTPIERIVLAGRSACFCPHCQPPVWSSSSEFKL